MIVDYFWPETNANITHLPLSNPLCANDTCLAFAAAGEKSQALISWNSQFLYGHYVCYFWGLILGVFAIICAARRLHYFHTSRSSTYLVEDRPTAGEKLLALGRSISYRRVKGTVADSKKLLALSPAILVAFSLVFAFIICFVQHPYYRQNRGYGSPPLGVRSGLAGVAMTPITLALSGKYNLISLLTGISHEKLNFLHRWCGYIYLFFGIVHTVPFLISAYNSGGPKRLYYQFYYAGSYEYTGIAPFAVLVFLCAFSNPWFRNRCYELFVHSHIAAAIVYLALIFWHAGNEGDSWIYLWITVGIWVVQLVARAWDKTAIFETRQKRRDGTARLMVLDGKLGQAAMLRISIDLPLQWTPGQHVFLRFPKLSALDNHPFTIASIPQPLTHEEPSRPCTNRLVFLVRPHRGITKRLRQHARLDDGTDPRLAESQVTGRQLSVRATNSLEVMVDGPYGGLEQHRAMNKLYDHVILIAGGGGISAMLPWVMSLSRRITDTEGPCRVQKISLIWCIRHASAMDWAEDELRECYRQAPSRVEIDVHVTEDRQREIIHNQAAFEQSSPEECQAKEVDANVLTSSQTTGISSDGGQEISYHNGRPHLPSLLPSFVSLPRTMIMGCGPESLKIDISNTAADLQKLVLHNSVVEVSLHTETFGW